MENKKTFAVSKEPHVVNYVHKQIIHGENIKKEKKFESKNIKLEYTFSPFTCNHFY